MTLYTEIEWKNEPGGQVTGVEPGSLAYHAGIRPGDSLLAINQTRLEDVIDVQFHGAEEELDLLLRRGDDLINIQAERDYGMHLGIEFAHPTFDTDIRRCNNLCEFCFVLQMAPKFRRTLYIKDDDYRYSFLFGHFVTLTNLSEHDWHRIETMGLSPLYISVHVTDLEKRRAFLRNPDAPDIMGQLRWLADRGIDFHTQLVIVPEFNDGPWMDRSINELAELWPSILSISVVPVGLTRHHKYRMRPHTPKEAAQMLDDLAPYQQRFMESFGERFVYPSDEWFIVADRPMPAANYYDDHELHENGLGMVRRFLDNWESEQVEIQALLKGDTPPFHANSMTLLTGTLFGGILSDCAGRFSQLTGIPVEVLPATNVRLGESITAAGLLMGGDVLSQLHENNLGEMVVLPRVMFDHPDVITLDDISPQDMANALKRPVALADTMGDVWDALIGESQVVYLPAGDGGEPHPLRVLPPDRNGSGSGHPL